MNLGALGEAYQRWKSVRNRLAHTVQDYVDVCNALDTAFSRHSGQSSFEKAIMGIDAELSGLEQDYERLSRTHVVLLRNRNRSKKLAPINNLPTEILSQIFQTAALTCAHQLKYGGKAQPYVHPDALAGVCFEWRKTAVNLPSLWSHIDLHLGGKNAENHYHCARAWSERATKSPLHVHILPILDPTASEESDILELLGFLASLAKNIGSLAIHVARSTEHIGRRIMACWATHGCPAIARSLMVGAQGPSLVKLLPWDSSDASSIPPRQVEEFFSSLQTLDLCGFHIPWESLAYHGLVSLLIGCGSGPGSCRITQSQLVTVLESSPKLRQLRLEGVLVQPEGWVARKPIVLEDLEALSVHESVHFVLPLIAPGSKPLKVIFSLEEYPVSLETVRSFFSRSTVETLYLSNPWNFESWFLYLLGPLQHLKALVIEECSFSVPQIRDFLAKPFGEGAVPWPRLHTLHLSGCVLDGDILLKLLSMHSVQNLQLHSCTTVHGSTKPENAEVEMLQLKELLTGVVLDTTLNNDLGSDPVFTYVF